MDRRIRRVTNVLDQQYRDPPSLEQLADDVGLSASRLAHLFREEVGRSIQSYILERRLIMAAMLIAAISFTIAIVAEKTRVPFGPRGYTDALGGKISGVPWPITTRFAASAGN